MRRRVLIQCVQAGYRTLTSVPTRALSDCSIIHKYFSFAPKFMILGWLDFFRGHYSLKNTLKILLFP